MVVVREYPFPWASGVLVVVSAFVACGLGLMVVSRASLDWYADLSKPPLVPSGTAVMTAWPVALITVVAGALLVSKSAGSFRAASSALGLYFMLLGAGMVWNLAFFGLEDTGLAFCIMAGLLLLAFAMVREFDRHSRTAALIQLPYLGWLLFASYMTASLWGANPGA